MKINRNLDEGILEHYADLLSQRSLEEEIGSYHVISFTGKEHALKSPIKDNPEKYDEFRKSLFKEFRMGIMLEKIRLNVPKMSGAYLVEGELPFLVMERRNLTGYRDLKKEEEKDFHKQYDKQIKLAKKEGFIHGDVDEEFNCGYDRKTKELVFYDFEYWRKVR